MRNQAQQYVKRARAQVGGHTIVQQQTFGGPDLEATETQRVLHEVSRGRSGSGRL
jgi:hypothetical protein